MSSATIIFTDVVGFSKLSGLTQKMVVSSLTNEIMYEIREYLVNNLSLIPNAIALPTGDGVAVVLVHNEPSIWTKEIILKILLRLISWQADFEKEKTNYKDIKIRIGLHEGGIEFFTDINGKTNICGNTINMAQRIMDAANDNQILVSDEIISKYFGSEYKESFTFNNTDYDLCFSDSISVTVKHGVRINVCNLIIDTISGYDNGIPYSSKYLVLSTTKLPKTIDGDFELKLKTAFEVALIQQTGGNLLSELEQDDHYFSKEIRRIFILMPSDKFIIFSDHEKSELKAKQAKLIVRWSKVIDKLKKNYISLNVELFLFNEPPYYGASYINWSKVGGSIHVSPYIWGVKTTECPGFDMVWNGSDEPEVYKKYVMGLDYLIGLSKK